MQKHSNKFSRLPLVKLVDLARSIKTNRTDRSIQTKMALLSGRFYLNTEELVNTVHETIGYYGNKMVNVEGTIHKYKASLKATTS